jgi:hypothetical protein
LDLAAAHSPEEVPCADSSFQGNVSIAASNDKIGPTSMEEDGLSLA